MFYILVGLWILAGLSAYQLRHARHNALVTSCPCTAVFGLVVSVILYLLHQPLAAAIVIVAALYVSATLLWSLGLQRAEHIHSKA